MGKKRGSDDKLVEEHTWQNYSVAVSHVNINEASHTSWKYERF